MSGKAAKTTVKVAVINNAAKDDYFQDLDWLTEDASLQGTLNVLGNDPGSAKIVGWSDSLPTTQAELTSKGSLMDGKLGVSINPTTGELDIDATGLNDDIQNLGEGVTREFTFYYTAQMANGAYSTAKVTFVIEGVNDAATISGDNAGAVGEDGVLSDGGSLSVSDVDAGENKFKAVDADDLDGDYGAFTFNDENGAWTFDLDNDAVQGLGEGELAYQTLTVYSLDGTDSETITVTITGKNDAADIAGDDTGAVTEDGTLVASGRLTIDDIDGDDEEEFVPQNAIAGKYGSFSIDAEGNWTYSLDNDDADLADLDAGESEDEEFTVYSLDGTAHVIKVTVNGADEAPTWTAPPVYTGPDADPNDFDANGNPAGLNTSSDASNGADVLYGGAGNDTINGGGGADTIYGGSGDDDLGGGNQGDTLYGGSGTDTIHGGNDADIIIGGYGADILTGNGGADTFRYLSARDTGDTITDFAPGDKIDLKAFAPSSFVGMLGAPGAVGANEVGYTTDGTTTTIYVDTDGVAGADLVIYLSNGYAPVAADFIFA